MTGWIAKLLGPRVLIGALTASIFALAFVTWQWQAARQNATEARSRAVELSQAVESSEAELSRALDRMHALDAALAAQRKRAENAQKARDKAERALTELENSNEQVKDWSDTRVPDDVRGWLLDS